MLDSKGVMIMADRESFVVKALIKKVGDAGYEATYVSPDINELNRVWDKNELLVYYMDTNDRLTSDVERFVIDKLLDSEIDFILIGDPGDTRPLTEHMPKNLILKTFKRPLDNEGFLNTVEKVFKDVAHEKWGHSWQMPTRGVLENLWGNCEKTWTTRNGVKGMLFTGPNGGSIFLPAAGHYWRGSNDSEGARGVYWSSECVDNGPLGLSNDAYILTFSIDYSNIHASSYYYGYSVRAIWQ